MACNLYEPVIAMPVRTVKDVAADKFIEAYAKHLKKSDKLECPKWADYVKTAHAKELAPYNPDWIYFRGSSILRRLYLRPGTGVGGFRKIYGSKKKKNSSPGHQSKASGKICRYLLQRFEAMGLVEQFNDEGGRRLTKQGQRELDTIALQLEAKE